MNIAIFASIIIRRKKLSTESLETDRRGWGLGFILCSDYIY